MTLKLISRAEWRAKSPSKGDVTPFTKKGIVIHWEGDGWKFPWDHSTCDDKVRNIQTYHMQNKGWSDIAYNFLVCPHGYTYEGRGLFKRSAANGDYNVNTLYYAVQCMWGIRAGVEVPTTLLAGAYDTIQYIKNNTAVGSDLLGHRDTNQTSCPGDELYAWVKYGGPNPNPSPATGALSMADAQTIQNRLETLIKAEENRYARYEAIHKETLAALNELPAKIAAAIKAAQ